MKLNFCTLFDSNYISRGLALHESLMENCPDFHLFIFAFDDRAYHILRKLELKNVTLIAQPEFEDQDLLSVKPTRTIAEYCWTCTPSIIRYSILNFHLDACTYLDADLLFYSNPEVLIREMGTNSVLITEHRYAPGYDQSATSGKYCVQFVTFKNDEKGMNVLNWWRLECIKWCFSRFEDGKFGDQKYLDDWTTRFEGVHELQHIGGGVAPWNLERYNFTVSNNRIYLREKGKPVELIFFHFHYLRFYLNNIVRLPSLYFVPKPLIRLLYFPYIEKLMNMAKIVSKIDDTFDPNAAGSKYEGPLYDWRYKDNYGWKDILHVFKKNILTFDLHKIKAGHRELIERGYYFKLNNLT